MELILTEDVPKLGNAGDLVKVKEGYGRNFLLPQKKALMANSKNIKVLEAQKKMIEARKGKVKKNAEEIAGRLGELEITISKDVGANDRLFGSVTKMDIVAALQKKGVQIDKHLIELKSPLKSIGNYEIPVKLHPDISANLKLWIIRKTEEKK